MRTETTRHTATSIPPPLVAAHFPTTAHEDGNTVIETITPTMAAHYLRQSVKNRPLQPLWVSRLAAAIKRGEWKVNGESIKFGSDGSLLDGHHRLNSIIRSGIPVETYVTRGIDPSTFDSIDQTKRRSAADVFAMGGAKNATLLQSACRAIYYIQAGGDFSAYVTTAQLEVVRAQHPSVDGWATAFTGSRARQFGSSSTVAVITLGSELHGEETAGYFLDKLSSGADLGSDSPIFVLRERLIGAKGFNTRLKPMAAAAMTIKAWNAYVLGKPLRLLKFLADEQFPILR